MVSILCIEDQPEIRQEIAEELESAGHKVIQAADGLEGLKAAVEDKPDLIICDVMMPNMNGHELLVKIRNEVTDLADVPFLYLTSLSDREHFLEGVDLGADDYLTKPIDFELLHAKVRMFMRQVSRMAEKKQVEHIKLYKALVNEKPEEEEAEIQPLSITLVGREADGLPLIRAVLRDWGHKVTTISSGRSFVQQAGLTKSDITFLWFYTDDMRGDFVAKMIKQSAPSAELGARILVRPEAMEGMPDYSEDWDVDDLLVLPCDDTTLRAVIEKWTGDESSHDKARESGEPSPNADTRSHTGSLVGDRFW